MTNCTALVYWKMINKEPKTYALIFPETKKKRSSLVLSWKCACDTCSSDWFKNELGSLYVY